MRIAFLGYDSKKTKLIKFLKKNGSYVLSAASKKKMNEAINQKKGDAIKGSSGASC